MHFSAFTAICATLIRKTFDHVIIVKNILLRRVLNGYLKPVYEIRLLRKSSHSYENKIPYFVF